ncbi:Cerato-ulmin hydrophobin family, partial [Coniella lustricola]
GSGSTTYDPCTSLLDSEPVCCATSVLGLVDLDCAIVSETPTSADDFVSICSSTGQEAQCCTLSLAGQALLCVDPVGA